MPKNLKEKFKDNLTESRSLINNLCEAKTSFSRNIILDNFIHIHLEDYGLKINDVNSNLYFGFMRGIRCALQQITDLDYGIDYYTLKRTKGLKEKLKDSYLQMCEKRMILKNWMHIHLEDFGLTINDLKNPAYRNLLYAFYKILEEVNNHSFLK
ncbi:MAG: hypothetical protein QXW97_03340 [Candidatus Pacearchaeota archaeon]